MHIDQIDCFIFCMLYVFLAPPGHLIDAVYSMAPRHIGMSDLPLCTKTSIKDEASTGNAAVYELHQVFKNNVSIAACTPCERARIAEFVAMPALAPGRAPRRSRVVSAASGAASGMMVGAILQPLDVMRTRMQIDGARFWAANPAPAIQAIWRESGWRGLWQGTSPTVLRLGVGAGLHFMFLETLRPLLLPPPGSKAASQASALVTAAALGGASRALAALVALPISIVKTRMEAGSMPVGAAPGVAAVLRDIWARDGPRGLIRGALPTLLSTVPFSAIHYMCYTHLQTSYGHFRLQRLEAVQKRRRDALEEAASGLRSLEHAETRSEQQGGVSAEPDARPLRAHPRPWPLPRLSLAVQVVEEQLLSTAFANFACSALAAATATMLTHPADVLRTHAQLAGSPAQRGTLATAVSLHRTKGASWMAAGLGPRVLKRALQSGLIWMLYELLLPRAGAAYQAALGGREQRRGTDETA